MSSLLYFLLTNLQQYSYLALWIIVYISAVGCPLPISLLLLGAGAFAATGSFNLFLLFAVCLTAAVCGDNTGYFIGRIVGPKLFEHFIQKKTGSRTASLLLRSQYYFRRRGALAIFFTRCLVSALGGTLNIVAGAELYPFHLFLLWDIIGEAIGDLIPLLLGYIFSVTWELIGTIFGNISLVILLMCVLIFLVYLAQRFLKTDKDSQSAHVRYSYGEQGSE